MRPAAWDVTREDVDRVVAGLSAQGLAASTRRGYVQAFKGFHAFLVARKASEIEAAFGVRLVNPVDEFNAARHVGSDSPSVNPPPDPERMEEFFDFLKERIAGARKYTAAGRDYALYRTLYLAGLRAEESASMDQADVHFGRGPFGKLHVRFGKGALTSGPRPRWVPMLDGLDLILRWYLEEIRPRLGDGPALFCDEGGGRMHRGTVRNRLACLLDLEQAAAGTDRGGEPARVRFSPHSLRHACATRNYEHGVDLVAIQQMLGHWHVGTTMRYVHPVGDVHRGRLPPRGLWHAGGPGRRRRCRLDGGCGWPRRTGKSGPARSCAACWPNGPGCSYRQHRCPRCSPGSRRR